ncbi:hypothetical protein EB796_004734 [Bugula neritina]|uniref:Uncharacterized protein n=1 Tax=Bugula neritina TaxID=10212 RepID=A0A7J7KE77_BUGNE|nr:hypothetical protein EB796_004734 [Bugula neritina]
MKNYVVANDMMKKEVLNLQKAQDKEIELETDLPLEKLAKFVSKKCKGKILKELGDGRYLVEIEDPEVAEKLLENDVMDYRKHKIVARSWCPDKSSSSSDSEGMLYKTLLLDRLLDVDHETLCFWVKSLTGCWPRSIQLSADGEKAVVRVPTIGKLDLQSPNQMASHADYHLHKEQNSASPLDGCPVYIVTYSSPEDVKRVIQSVPHKQGPWTFDVAEYYVDVGVCKPNSLVLCPPYQFDQTEIAERVYHKTSWLNEHHDRHRVRVSGLTEELDPEKLRFYLSALSNNSVTQMSFNEDYTKAVADFHRPMSDADFGQLIHSYQKIPMPECPVLKIQQEPKPHLLVATSDSSQKKFKNMTVSAKRFEGTQNIWRINTDPEGLRYLIDERQNIQCCKDIRAYSEFLGLHTNFDTQRVRLSSLVPCPLTLRFLQDSTFSGYKMVREFLQKQSLLITSDDAICPQFSDDKANRAIHKNWRGLRRSLRSF